MICVAVALTTLAAGPSPPGSYRGPYVLTPPSPAYYDLFGRTVAVRDGTLAVTAGHELGRVHVYRRRSRDVWQLVHTIAAPRLVVGFGRALALTDNKVVVGSDQVSAYVYDLATGSLEATLHGAGTNFDGVAATDDMVVLTGRNAFPRVWTKRGAEWSLTQELQPPELTTASMGGGVGLHDQTLAVAAMLHTERLESQGAVVIYRRGPEEWEFEQMVTAEDPRQHHFMGTTLAVSDDVVAATTEQGTGNVYVFHRDAQQLWHQAAKLAAPPGAGAMHFASVTMPDANTLLHSGSTGGNFVYRRVQTGVWQLSQDLGRSNAGWRASSSGRLLAIPSANDTVDSVKLAGTVFLFER